MDRSTAASSVTSSIGIHGFNITITIAIHISLTMMTTSLFCMTIVIISIAVNITAVIGSLDNSHENSTYNHANSIQLYYDINTLYQ